MTALGRDNLLPCNIRAGLLELSQKQFLKKLSASSKYMPHAHIHDTRATSAIALLM